MNAIIYAPEKNQVVYGLQIKVSCWIDFSFEKLERELERRAPFTHAVLRTSCVNKRNSKERSEWVPTIGMAASIILRNKSSRLNAVQVLQSIFLYHSSWTVGVRFLKSVYILLIGFLHLMFIYQLN